MSALGRGDLAPRWWRLTVACITGLLIAGFVGAAAADGYILHPSAARAAVLSLELVGVAALFFRSRWTTAVLAVEVPIAAASAALVTGPVHAVGVVATVVALYTYGTRRPSERTIVAAAATTVVITVADGLSQGSFGPFIPDTALFTAVTAVSFYVRSHRALMVSYRERAEQAEREQEWTASRAVAAERVRIARELHDVVAHHVSLLVVQAGAVRETLPADHQTRPVLDSMIAGGRQAMTEMRDMLDALRLDDSHQGLLPKEDTEAGAAPRSPQPTSDQIPALVTGARSAGLPVTLTVAGTPAILPPTTSLAAYRIVQEALTNAVKHAPGAFTTVRLAYEPGILALNVRNGPPPRPPNQPNHSTVGHGIVGMNERAVLADGTITIGPTTNGWEVNARLPIEAASAETNRPVTIPSPAE